MFITKRRVSSILLALFFPILLLLAVTRSAMAYYTNMSAGVVLGQPDFTSNTANNSGVLATSMSNPIGSFFDGQRLFVADITNNRVLIWNSMPTKNNTPADIVLGQPDFTSNTANNGGISAQTLSGPIHIFSDGSHLVISDGTNKRVLIWNSMPTTNQQAADVVVGQPDFVTSSGGATATKYNVSFGVSIHDSKLIVADSGNRRVLIYNSIPTTNGASADVVIGQANFTSNENAVTANRFAGRMMVVKNNKLFVEGANRVLIWNSIPTTNDISADVVVGQPDFTSDTADNGGVSCASLTSPEGIAVTDKGRLVIGDTGRVLIYNEIPTKNYQSADVVLGQPNCSSRVTNFGGLSSSSLGIASGNTRVSVDGNNKIIVSDSPNNRILIFDNVVATPGLDIDPNPEALSDGRFRLKGNIVLGERDRYSMQTVKVSVNGEGFGQVTSLDGGRDDGEGSTRYEFRHEFSPWVSIDGVNKDNWGGNTGYTLKVKASSFNADDTTLFYFTPFKLLSFTDGALQTLKFSVPKEHAQRIKDEVDHFEAWVKKEGSEWSQYIPNIPFSKIDIDTGEASYSEANTLPKGKYEIKVVAVSKDSNWRQDSNSITQEVTGATFNNLLNLPISPDLPFQVNTITGVNSGILSTLNLSGIDQGYKFTTSTPTFTGISYAHSEISLIVTDNNTGEFKTYQTTVNPDSSFSVSPTLFPNSTIDISTFHPPSGQFNLLPSMTLTLNAPTLEEETEEVQGTGIQEAPEEQPKPSSTPQLLEEDKQCFLFICW